MFFMMSYANHQYLHVDIQLKESQPIVGFLDVFTVKLENSLTQLYITSCSEI